MLNSAYVPFCRMSKCIHSVLSQMSHAYPRGVFAWHAFHTHTIKSLPLSTFLWYHEFPWTWTIVVLVLKDDSKSVRVSYRLKSLSNYVYLRKIYVAMQKSLKFFTLNNVTISENFGWPIIPDNFNRISVKLSVSDQGVSTRKDSLIRLWTDRQTPSYTPQTPKSSHRGIRSHSFFTFCRQTGTHWSYLYQSNSSIVSYLPDRSII